MCSVIAWAGKLPPRLLDRLMCESEVRGRDSTGLAFRTEKSTVIYRQVIRPRSFVKLNRVALAEASRSACGIAHARRASRGMPVNVDNAHPFSYRRVFFAHNGRIRNWEELKKGLSESPDKYDVKYSDRVTTDSMVLGPHIVHRDFARPEGCMGLVWLDHGNAFALRTAKELEIALIKWKFGRDSGSVCIAASTEAIILNAVKKLALKPDITFYKVNEGVVYQLTENGPLDHGSVEVNANNSEDAFTSSVANAIKAGLDDELKGGDARAYGYFS